MKRMISDSFGELFELTTNDRRVPIAALPALHDHAVALAPRHGLEYIGSSPGRHLVLSGEEWGGVDRILTRQKLYVLRPHGTELDAAADLVAAMAEKHGPGRWWSTGGSVGYVEDGSGGARVADINGEPHVWLRMYYFHDPAAPTGGATE